MSNYRVFDNFLPDDQFNYIANSVVRDDFLWNFNNSVAFNDTGEDNNYYFTHSFYDKGTPICPLYNYLVDAVAPCLLEKAGIELRAVIRIKCNLYPRTEKVVAHDLHADYLFPNHSCLLGINDNDGYTMFENGDKVESRANRMVVFNGQDNHCSTTCTDQKVRLNINFNLV